MNKKLKQVLFLVGIGLTACIVVILFLPVRDWLLDRTWKLLVDLLAIALIVMVAAALLSPLEALGWWAGWYRSELDTQTPAVAVPLPNIEGYVIYLEGVNQDEFEYVDKVENFLQELAAALPNHLLIGRQIMAYSVLNKSLLDPDRPLSFFWRLIDWIADRYPKNFIGFLVNIRNIIIVSVSADLRYGPIYNQGSAQVILNSLLSQGYQPGSAMPITLIGYSGGAQIAAGAATYLWKALGKPPIEIVSLGGVISGNNQYLHLRHLYHLVGKKDSTARLGPLLFPGRRSFIFWSKWNRALGQGKITIVPMGPMVHNGPKGYLDSSAYLPDGRSYLRKTLDVVGKIVCKDSPKKEKANMQQSNYEIYRQAAFNQPSYYPLVQSVDGEHYRPIGLWMGRLILQRTESARTDVLLEVYHADREHQYLVGDIVKLRWSDRPDVEDYVERLYRDVCFSEETRESQKQGKVHPDRLNNWHKVDPLESLAGARPEDDVIVMLPQVVVEENSDNPRAILVIFQEPIQITGRYRGLVKIVGPVCAGSEDFQVIHFNRDSQEFDGTAEVIRLPQVVADQNGLFASTSNEIEKSPLNPTGWYIYGAKNAEEVFVVQAIAPRALFALEPISVILGEEATIHYIKEQYWDDREKGTVSSVLLDPQAASRDEAISRWQEGDRAIVMHVYGGIGGEKGEHFPMGINFGHFSFGVAQVVRDALTDELRFEIDYKQIYTQNTDGIIPGTQAWSQYMGDRQWGWLGCRPVADILVKLDAFTTDYNFDGIEISPSREFIRQLDIMMARYRIGDGTGGTYVGPSNSCVQDSFQALYVALKGIEKKISCRPYIQDWIGRHPDHEQTRRYQQLASLGQGISEVLEPLEIVRSDWQDNIPTLGISAIDYPLESFFKGLKSWRTMLPRLAQETVAEVLLKLGASLWVLRTNQVGGFDPDIEPIAPTDFF